MVSRLHGVEQIVNSPIYPGRSATCPTTPDSTHLSVHQYSGAESLLLPPHRAASHCCQGEGERLSSCVHREGDDPTKAYLPGGHDSRRQQRTGSSSLFTRFLRLGGLCMTAGCLLFGVLVVLLCR